MDNRHLEQRDSSASGFQILASSLPEMVKAMSQGSVDKKRKLGGISSRVARHLKAEICSIFLLDRHGKLFLEEAYGYDVDAIGTEKSLDEGLTARILKDKLTIVANFDVQDGEGWKGQLDDKLKGHCWCMLGVPIIGANNIVRGVIKVENRRRQIADQNTPRYRSDDSAFNGRSKDKDDEASVSEMCTFLRAMASAKNTPKAICEVVDNLAGKTLRVLESARQQGNSQPDQIDKLQELVDQTHLLADSLAKCGVSVAIGPGYGHGKNIRRLDASDDGLDNLESRTLQERISSLRWYTEALTASVMRIMSSPPIQCGSEPSQAHVDVVNASRAAVALLQSLKLALDAYEPFGQEDLYLMRAVAAMIAAALDIREAAGKEALHTLRHALRSGASLLLQNVCKLSHGESDVMPELFRTALYISGQQGVFRTFEKDSRETITFENMYKETLLSRFCYYHDYLRTANKKFEFPDEKEIPHDLKQKRLLDTDAIVASLDIIIVNAEKHPKGASNVRLDIRGERDSCLLIVSDDGSGFDSEKLSEMQVVWDSKSSEESFPEDPRGLLAAKWTLKRANMELEIGNGLEGCLKGAYAKIIIPFVKEVT